MNINDFFELDTKYYGPIKMAPVATAPSVLDTDMLRKKLEMIQSLMNGKHIYPCPMKLQEQVGLHLLEADEKEAMPKIDPQKAQAAEMDAAGMAPQGAEDPGMGGMPPGGDPGMGGMGMEQKPPDPMAGFGDSTAKGVEQDPSGMGMGGMGMGMGGPQGPLKNMSALGRLFTLKKLFFKFQSLNNLLNSQTDEKLKDMIAISNDSFKIFKLVIANLKSYKETIDEIIIMFYKLIRELTHRLHIYLKRKYDSHIQE